MPGLGLGLTPSGGPRGGYGSSTNSFWAPNRTGQLDVWLRSDIVTTVDAAVTAPNDVSNAAWTKTNCTTPDTQTIRDALDVGQNHAIFQSPYQINHRGTLTVEAKAGTLNWIELQLGNGSGGRAFINLTTGALGTTVGSPTVTITSMADNWWRIVITGDVLVTGQCHIMVTNADNAHTYNGTGTGTILVRNISVDQKLVSVWPDMSGLGHNLSQSTASKRPEWQLTGGLNGNPVIIGDTVDDFLRGTWTSPQPLDMWLIGKWGAATGGQTMFDGSTGNTHRMYGPSTTAPIITADGVSNLQRTTTDITTNYHCYHGVYNGTSSSFQIDDGTVINGTMAGTAAGGLILNIFGDQVSAPAGGSFLEVIRYSTAPTAERTALTRAYLKTKYGV